MEWAPTFWGRLLTQSADWKLVLANDSLTITGDDFSATVNAEHSTRYSVHKGRFWTCIAFHPTNEPAFSVDGLPNAEADRLIAELSALQAKAAARHVQQVVNFLQQQKQKMDGWLKQKHALEQRCLDQHRWLTHEMQQALLSTRPQLDENAIRTHLQLGAVVRRLGGDTVAAIKNALAECESNHTLDWKSLNSLHETRELKRCKPLLDTVEKKPLTPEQARAVVSFDNRVQVIASAGSGKTSTMVAKAAYAIHCGIATPERIVMLAFNDSAAKELGERAEGSFKRIGMHGTQVKACTFHAMGLEVIGHATGRKPSVPDWAKEDADGIKKLAELIDDLKDRDAAYRTQWDLFRFVFGRDPGPVDAINPDEEAPKDTTGSLITAMGKPVKSQEELMLANWLFYNGVPYEYEREYEHPTADATHKPYQPDFYYPQLKLYHEHFALDANGQPPAAFKGYLSGVHWKRGLHQRHGTELFETTSHGLRRGNDLERLAAELTRRGVILDPNPDRPQPKDGQKPLPDKDLVNLVRSFIRHAKNNSLDAPQLRARLQKMSATAFKHRQQMFLELALPAMKAWDAELKRLGSVDFEDMLNQASTHLEQGYTAPFDLVMADEFQDTSVARARFCKALVRPPGRFFFAVGDDWQSINRFAGADVSVMTGFKNYFGHGQTHYLQQTFRCPQALCDVSSRFVMKNPVQLPKGVQSATAAQGAVLRAIEVDHANFLKNAIGAYVADIAAQVRDGRVAPGRDSGKLEVHVLGRYNNDKKYVPDLDPEVAKVLEVKFLSMHRSKGREADYVILPNMVSVARELSFPSTLSDDPVLALAMPGNDDFPQAEERRLFYVALTRARRSVAMFTVRGAHSTFLTELVREGAVEVMDGRGRPVGGPPCPTCKTGTLRRKKGKNGPFIGCSAFPACKHTQRVAAA